MAKFASKNGPKGSPVTSTLSVHKDLHRNFLIEKLFSAVRNKFPFGSGRTVCVQQDNA